MTIRPLKELSREEVEDLARTAADNGEPLPAANPFELGTERSAWFVTAYWARDAALRGCEA